ncbi:MAG: NADH-quinone oxidoreductase subunit C [Deltaproteobacteria bacterium]|nr:NADH-quinone oxidoreductase subunit C [Deltaproteobacteria bacterium]
MSKPILDKLQAAFPDAVLRTEGFRGDDTAIVARERIVEVCRWLKDTPGCAFNFCMDLCGVDYPDREDRFDVVYHLYALSTGKRVRLKVRVPQADPVVASVTDVWIGADWFERECYDLFGIRFAGHPHLRRLLTFEEFEGHALRKDYPRNKRQKIPTPDPLL